MHLEQSELRRVVPNLHLPVFEFDLDLKLVYANQAALDFLNYDESVIGIHVDELVAEEFRHLVHEGLKALLEGAKPSSISLRAVRSDNLQIPIEVFSDRLFNEGNEVGFVVYVLDMTRRSRIEEKLKEQKEFFDLVIEHSHAGIFIIDDNYSFEYVNDKLCDIVGRTRSELLGHDFREFVHPDSLEMVADRYVKRQRGEDVPKTYTFKAQHSSGATLWVEITSVTMQAKNGTIKTVAQLMDITEETEGKDLLKESEHRYRSLVETMADGLAVDDENGRIVYANNALARMMGYEHGEEVLGLRDGDVLNGFSPDVFQKKYLERRAGVRERYEIDLKHKSGKLIPVIVSASPFFNMDGEFAGTFAIFSDLSELKSAEAEATFLLDLLMHDIGNQLQLILAGSDLCNKESSLDVVEGAQQYVRDGAQRCLDLITKIRRAEEAKGQPLTPTDIIPVIKSEINLLKRLYDIEVVQTDLPDAVMIMADSALSQMIWNLMENAVKHNPIREKMVWVEGNLKENEFDFVVADNGPGLGPAERVQIFEEIRRFGGVGLHIVRQLVNKYGARLKAVDRVPGYTHDGLKVTISFRLAPTFD